MRRGLVWSLAFIISASVIALMATVATGHRPLLGLDLKGGVSVVLQPHGRPARPSCSRRSSIIDRRVNGLGVANSTVARQGNDIVINLPGIKNAQARPGSARPDRQRLYFRPVICQIPPYAAAANQPTTLQPLTADVADDQGRHPATRPVRTSASSRPASRRPDRRPPFPRPRRLPPPPSCRRAGRGRRCRSSLRRPPPRPTPSARPPTPPRCRRTTPRAGQPPTPTSSSRTTDPTPRPGTSSAPPT